MPPDAIINFLSCLGLIWTSVILVIRLDQATAAHAATPTKKPTPSVAAHGGRYTSVKRDVIAAIANFPSSSRTVPVARRETGPLGLSSHPGPPSGRSFFLSPKP
jgi:hypothetical protein